MTKGWIKLHRKFIDWEWYSDVPTKVLYIHLLLDADHKGRKWKGKDIQKGQCVVGRKALAEKTGLSERQVRTALEKLKETGEILCEATNKYTLVTIVNYELYQGYEGDERPTDVQQMSNKCPTDVQQMSTNKNIKNEKNIRNIRNINISYVEIIDLYHSLCPSFPHIRTISEGRKKAIKARLNTYSIEDFKTLFEKAEASDFLKGNNNRNWSADFDWLIKDTNMPKVLEGKYDNKDRDTGWQFADLI